MYGYAPLLSTWKYHNIVNQLFQKKKKVKKKGKVGRPLLFVKLENNT